MYTYRRCVDPGIADSPKASSELLLVNDPEDLTRPRRGKVSGTKG